eukprot:gene9052-18749_t
MVQIFDGIDISFNDKRSYRHVLLDNNLQVLLIHDPETEKSSAACDVKVGSMCDPKEAPGLAHFLEHMLFLGTEKYPEENAYSSYLNAHGGHSNAYTAQEDTVYYFDIQNDFLEHALDMFASFFISPLFTEEATSREMNAVDNENTKNLQSDMWRQYQLMKFLARPDHPYSNFSTGNLQTLKVLPEQAGLDIRNILLDFHKRFYSANVMRLVVYGKDDLDTLQKWVEEKFTPIEDKNLSVPSFPSDPYRPEQLAKIIEVVPVKDSKGVDFSFLLPPVDEFYHSKPTSYLAHLIGHEGPGSILSLLKKKGWANGLSAHTAESLHDFAAFGINVELTDNGVENVHRVISVVFEYIGMLRREGPKEWIATEVKEISDMNFRFLNKCEPADYTTKLANHMHIYPKEDIISGEYLLKDPKTTLALSSTFLEYLTPSRVIIKIKHRGLQGKTSLQEPWYGTAYNSLVMTEEQKKTWNAAIEGIIEVDVEGELSLPEPNPFLPTDFTLRCDGDEKEEGAGAGKTCPVLVENVVIMLVIEGKSEEKIITEPSVDMNDDSSKTQTETETEPDVVEATEEEKQQQETGQQEGEAEGNEEEAEADGDVEEGDEHPLKALPGRVRMTWYKPDDKWKVPKVNVVIKLETLQSYISPLHVALTEMYGAILKEKLNEYAYYADCAGLHYDIQNTRVGLDLSFYGYQHKLPILVIKTLEEMSLLANKSCDEDLFHRLKQKQLRSYYNLLFSQPYYHCIMGSVTCLEEPRWTALEKHASLTSTTLDDFQTFANVLLRQMRYEILVHGNASQVEAQKISLLVEEHLKSGALPHSQEPIRRVLAIRPGYQYIYRQNARDCNPKEVNSAIENLYLVCKEDVSHLLSEPLFDQLRTKEQLGYIVHNAIAKIGNINALRIIIQSNNTEPMALDDKIESFLISYHDVLEKLSEEDLKSNIQAVIEKLVEKPKNLDQETQRHWQEISSSTYLFNRRQLQADFLQNIKLSDVMLFYKMYIMPNDTRRKFTSQFYGANQYYPLDKKSHMKKSKVIIVKDPAVFKTTLPLLPARNYIDNVELEDEVQTPTNTSTSTA